MTDHQINKLPEEDDDLSGIIEMPKSQNRFLRAIEATLSNAPRLKDDISFYISFYYIWHLQPFLKAILKRENSEEKKS